MSSNDTQQERILRFKINGADFSCVAVPGETLTQVIREKAHLTGTKVGCDMGTCGCCTVLVDGEPRLSCLTLAMECEGAEITTIEGLNEGVVHPLSRAFAEKGGSQCGFCTPGFIMTAAHHLESNPEPTVEELREVLSGNLCRCTGYIKIYDAVIEAARHVSGQPTVSNPELEPAK